MKSMVPEIAMSLCAAFAAQLRADTIGFWDFRDGAPGTDVSEVYSTGGTATFRGTADRTSVNGGVMPRFSSDSPGKVVASSRDLTPLSEAPQSIDFRYVSREDRQGGLIDMDGLANAIVGKGDFTIECFVKMNEDYVYWMQGDGRYDQISKTVLYLEAQKDVGGFKLIAPSSVVTGGDNAGAARGFGFETYRRDGVNAAAYNSAGIASDGKWHHLALVYSETNATEQTGTLTYYVDYSPIGSPVAYRNSTSEASGLKFRLGTGYKDGAGAVKTSTEPLNASLSCLRVSSGALSTEDFEIVSPFGAAVFAIGFNDESATSGAKIGDALNQTLGLSIHSDLGLALTAKFGYGLHPETFPQYDKGIRRIGYDVQWGSKKVWKNGGGCRFLGYSSLASGTPHRQYAGTEMSVDVSSHFLCHPPSWTMEAFVKVEYDQDWRPNGVGSLLFGKYTYDWHKNNAYPQFCWMLTRRNNGVLRLSWTEVTESGEYSQDEAESFERYVETSEDCLGKKWRHVALSYDKPTRTFRLYVDYNVVMTASVGERGLLDRPCGYYFSRMSPTDGFEGWMDEIRFSWGALAPEDLVRFAPVGGMVIIR